MLGVLLHFTFEWSGKNTFVGVFSSVNESTWEHLKLLFFPMLVSAIIGYFIIGKESLNYWFSKAIGIVFSLIFLIIVFYTFEGIFGFSNTIFDILLFFISLFLGEFISYKLLIFAFPFKNKFPIILIILFLAFIIFTFYPPKINLFKCPTTNTYGIDFCT